MYRLTEKKAITVCEKLILKTKVKVSVYLLGHSSDVSVMANFEGTHTPMHVLKSGERKDDKTLRQHL